MIQNFYNFSEGVNTKIELETLVNEYLAYLIDDKVNVNIIQRIPGFDSNVYEIRIELDYERVKWTELLIWSNIKDDIVPFIQILQLKGYQILPDIGFKDSNYRVHYHNIEKIDNDDFQRELRIMFKSIYIRVIN